MKSVHESRPVRAYAPSAKGAFFGDLGEGQLTGERSEPVFTGAAGGNFAKFNAKMVNFNAKWDTGLSTGKKNQSC